jgi:hypothetical protein
VIPDYKMPTYISGIIEFEGSFIPVIDPGIYYQNNPVWVTNATCVLVLEHNYKSHTCRTGVLIKNIEEIMNLAAGCYKTRAFKPASFNMRFVLEIPDNVDASELLSNTHVAYELREQQKQADADFAAFREIISRSVDCYDSNQAHSLMRYPTPRTVSM